jgi:hypothetical protein
MALAGLWWNALDEDAWRPFLASAGFAVSAATLKRDELSGDQRDALCLPIAAASKRLGAPGERGDEPSTPSTVRPGGNTINNDTLIRRLHASSVTTKSQT